MGRILAILEIPPIRSTVSPSPYSPLLTARRLGGVAPLELLVGRIRRVSEIADLAVVTDSEQYEVAEARLANSTPLYAYGDDGFDALSRIADVARRASATSILRILAGHPFVDPDLVERLLRAARRRSICDYASYFTGAGRRALMARLGMIVEWVTSTALERADRAAMEPEERRDPTRYIHSHPELFQLRLLPLAPPSDRREMRLSLQHDEDWEHAQVIFEALGPERLAWPQIADLVGANPALRARMEQLNRSDRV